MKTSWFNDCDKVPYKENSFAKPYLPAEPVYRLVDAAKAVLEVEEDNPCHYDHHGYCQAHNLRTNDKGEGECQIALIKAAIAPFLED